MSRGTRTLYTAAVIAAAVLVLTWLMLPPAPFTAPEPGWHARKTDVRGVFHVHTRRSDGTGTVDEVAAAAARAGLQFVIITDHGDATRPPDPPCYRSGVLCIDAVEISTSGGHYAAIGLGPAPYPLGGEPRDVAEDVRRLGGFGIVTHPLSEKSDLAWRGWGVRADAIEWLNGDSLWRDVAVERLARGAWTYLFRPVASIAQLYQRPATLSRWDSMDRGWRVVALAGTDAHARLGFRDGPEPYQNPIYFRAPSYRVAFEVASLRVRLPGPLTYHAAADAEAIVSAIRAGRLHTVVDGLGRNAAFDFTVTSGGVSVGEGGAVPLTDPAVVRIRSNPPAGGWLVLYRNGTQVHRVKGQELTYASDQPGTYRAEVWAPAPGRQGFVPWIVGNAAVVGPADPPPAGSPPETSGTSTWLATDSDIWGVEHAPGSNATLDRTTGVGVRYALAASGSSAPYAALQATTAVAPGAAGIAFVARADRPMRVSVQLRVPTAGEGLRWHRSIYLDPSPREVFVPFDEMTPLGDTPAGPPRLAAIRTVLFVVDLVNARRGATGQFVVQDVRFYSAASAEIPQK